MSDDPRFTFRGGNRLAYHSRKPEILLAGAAGTGKSLVLLVKVLRVADRYAGCRVLVCRKTRASLTETALVTFERDVLGPDSVVLRKNPTLRRVRQSYRLPNGSEIVVAGLDKPDKVLSAEYDLCYAQEATELTLTDWETLGSRLRNGRVPYQQMLADCNPTTPTHWLYKRAQAGSLALFPSTHKDNPRFWDESRNAWTPDGEQYLARLNRLTGVRRKRFLDGVWAAAEGLVYDQFDSAVHVVEPFPIPSAWRRFHAIDFGFTNPLAYQFWAEDPDGRLYLYREYYKTGVLVEDVAKWVKADLDAGIEPRPVAVIGDHDAEDRATFERHSGLKVTPADKGVVAGIQDMQARLDLAADGRPRMFFVRGALCHAPDPVLSEAGKPTCTLDELPAYVWDNSDPERPKDAPVKANDHGCFVAGTPVETAGGPRPIESIAPGDLVWTRDGLRPVVDAGLTDAAAPVYEVALSDGRALYGTGNHPVWSPGRGFVRLDDLRYGSRVSNLPENREWTSSNCRGTSGCIACGSWASSTAATPGPSSRRTGTTSAPVPGTCEGIGGPIFTATSGLPPTARYRTATSWTTGTATHSTTPCPICNCSPFPSTRPSTPARPASGAADSPHPFRQTGGRQCLRRPPSGTGRRRGEPGTAGKALPFMPRCPVSRCGATCAVRPIPSSDSTAGTLGSVPTIAGQRPDAGPAWTTAPAAARAGQGSCATSTASRSIAPAFVLAVTRVGVAPVFNLSVDGCPEYYANGVLVHNCDPARYLCRHLASKPSLSQWADALWPGRR